MVYHVLSLGLLHEDLLSKKTCGLSKNRCGLSMFKFEATRHLGHNKQTHGGVCGDIHIIYIYIYIHT